MAEQAPLPEGQNADPNAPQFVPQAVYLKDVSFESPIFAGRKGRLEDGNGRT